MNLPTLKRIRKHPDLARAHVKAICTSREIIDNRKGTTFVGRGTLTERQLNYMIECAKETRKRKTW